MSEPYLGEIRLFTCHFAPKGWALCNGEQLPINQNSALFALLGTTYGGNGVTTFALPDLRGRVPIHVGGGFSLGQMGGEEAHTLSIAEIPSHIHAVQASGNVADQNGGDGAIWATTAASAYYKPGGTGAISDTVSLHPDAVSSVGGSQAHNNMQPYLVLNYCVALQGVFPSRS